MTRTHIPLAYTCTLVALGLMSHLAFAASATYSYDINGNQTAQQTVAPALPVIARHPADALLQPGGTVRFSVVASGTGVLTYQWRHDGADIPGATGDVLVVPGLAIDLADYGDYSVVVSNGPGSSVTSSPATVLPDSDTDGMADPWELQNFGDLAQSAIGDSDGDKVSNYDEWRNGSDPGASEIYLWPAGNRWFHYDLGATSSSAETINIRIGLPFPSRRYFAPGNSPSLTATGLPRGVAIDPLSGIVSGTPTATGTFIATISAQTDYGIATETFTVHIPPVVTWGYGAYGLANVPPSLTDVVAISGGGIHTLALKSDGSVVAWGYNVFGQCNVPGDLSGVVAIDAGDLHSIALKADGTVVAWGGNNAGQYNVPEGLAGVVAIKAGAGHSLALKADGTVVAWGRNDTGQCNVPEGLRDVVAVAAGLFHSLALLADGRILAWGGNTYGQTSVPPDLTDVVSIAAGIWRSRRTALWCHGEPTTPARAMCREIWRM